MQPIKVIHNGREHQVLEISKPLYNSSMITNIINTGGRLAVDLTTNELTIIRGESVVDFHKQIAARASNTHTGIPEDKAQPQRAELLVNGRLHWSAPREAFIRAKDLQKASIKEFIADGYVVEVRIDGRTYRSDNKAFWMNFARIK